MSIAKIFWNGNSQAVRLPKQFRFSEEYREVSIRREGEALILEPKKPRAWPEDFWQAFDGMPEDFERPEQVRQQRESFEL